MLAQRLVSPAKLHRVTFGLWFLTGAVCFEKGKTAGALATPD